MRWFWRRQRIVQLHRIKSSDSLDGQTKRKTLTKYLGGSLRNCFYGAYSLKNLNASFLKTNKYKTGMLIVIRILAYEERFQMEYIKFSFKINNVVGYILIATIVLSPIGFIQVLVGYLVLLELKGTEKKKKNIFGIA